MEKQDYTISISVNTTPEEAYNGINQVADWWSTNFQGQSANLNDVFTVSFGQTSITIKVVKLVPFQKIGWHVIDCYKHWLKDKKEWKDTTMTWEISSENDVTNIHFIHFGLVPGIECYNDCEGAWNQYITGSLFKLLTDGVGVPS